VKLFHARGARSARVRWLFEELDLPYHVEKVDIQATDRAEEHLRHHPHGKVPAVVDGELSLIESAAIVLHYTDVHPEKDLAPKPGTPERAQYYQWIIYAAATVDPLLSTLWKDRENEQARTQLATVFAFLARGLGDREWFVDNRFTAADVALGWDLAFANYMKLVDDPKLQAYVKRIKERPAFKRAYAD
jgi:glutathione S-transferase